MLNASKDLRVKSEVQVRLRVQPNQYSLLESRRGRCLFSDLRGEIRPRDDIFLVFQFSVFSVLLSSLIENSHAFFSCLFFVE